jgi:predicted hydrocarbon binding protein
MANELAKLFDDDDKLIKLVKNDEFLAVINQNPPAAIVKEHPFAKGVKYIPIEKIETMLTKIFQDWYIEVLDSGQLLNSIYVTIRLHYKSPVTEEWHHQDGVGATAIQVDQGKNASDLGAIKSNAIMLALPAAKSYALKDAAEHIGKVFGRDINRKDVMNFVPSYATEDNKAIVEKRKEEMRRKVTNENNPPESE